MSEANLVAEPLTLPSGLVLSNRMAKAAMSENLADADGAPSEALIRLYERLGRGGAGLLITGNAAVDPGGRTERDNVQMIDDHGDRLTAWAKAAKAHGSAIFMQLSHAGRQTARPITWRPVAPSAVKLDRKGGLFSTPEPLTIAQIEVLVARFGNAAAMAEAAGFDGVQLHAAHGYLISQFLSPLTNRRTDRYGGDLEGRMRFLMELIGEVRRVTTAGFSVAVKLNSADFQRGGFTLEDSMEVAKALETAGIDLLEISGGSYEKPAMMGDTEPKRASTRAREAFFLEYAERMREVVKIPLMVTGGFRSRAAMNAALGGGATDVIGMARPLAVEPDLLGQLVRGEVETATEHDISVGVRLLDDLLQIHWYQQQLHRMGRGQEPDPRMSRWGTVLHAMGTMYFELATSWVHKRGHALDAPPTVAGAVTGA